MRDAATGGAPLGRAVVCCWFPTDIDPEAICAAAMPRAPAVAREARVRLVPEDANAWRAGLDEQAPFTLGRFTVVSRASALAEHAPALYLQPGLAFGGGRHPTTIACVAALEATAAPERALDVGTGTGVLALVTAHRGAKRVVATDIDPLARSTARAHARDNGLASRITVQAELPPCAPGFGLVIANLYLGPLRALLPALVARVARGGRLIVSGFTAEVAPEIAAQVGALGLRAAAAHASGRWRALSFRRLEDR